MRATPYHLRPVREPRAIPQYREPYTIDGEWVSDGPSSFAISIRPIRLTVSFESDDGKDVWIARAYNFLGKSTLKAQETEAAKIEALGLLKEKVRETVDAIGALIPKKRK